jgi:hypothetical protein
VQFGDRVGITAGLPSGKPGTTSLLQIRGMNWVNELLVVARRHLDQRGGAPVWHARRPLT